MTFESEGLLIVAIYTWLPPASYVVFSDNSGYGHMVIIYSETLKTPIQKFLIFKIYETFSNSNEFLSILYHKIDSMMS